MAQIKIDKGIPLLDTRRGDKVYPFDELEVGDSFLMRSNNRSVVKYYNDRLSPKKFTSRMTPEGIRIWRIE